MDGIDSALARVDRLVSQWGRNAPPLPPDAHYLLRRLVRRVVLDAAKVCGLRAAAEGKPLAARGEAAKCASAVRHLLLCTEGQQVCLRCDGEGCDSCGHQGVVTPGQRGEEHDRREGESDGLSDL